MTQYFYCDNLTLTLDLSYLFTCENGYYCDDLQSVVDRNPCRKYDSTSFVPSCGIAAFPVNQKLNGTIFCRNKRVGRHVQPSDTSCKSYVKCFLNKVINGSEYKCPGSLLFNNEVGVCTENYTCPTPVTVVT